MLANYRKGFKPAKCIILVNPLAHEGKAWKNWLSLKERVYRRISLPIEVLTIEKGVTTKTLLDPALNANETACIISAGGDGSLHHLVNYLLTLEQNLIKKLVIGALGLGSSNDFLKPFKEKIQGIPVRLNYMGNHIAHDIGMVTYQDENNALQKKYFMVNASLGVTARANYNFNNPGSFLKFLKKKSTTTAIVYTALNTILSYRNSQCRVAFSDKQAKVALSNVNVLKVPFVSGSFFYQQNILRDDGKLAFNMCHNMSRWELISVLQGLQKGRFPASEKTKSALVTECHFTSEEPMIFECDGETEKSKSVYISILPNALNVLEN